MQGSAFGVRSQSWAGADSKIMSMGRGTLAMSRSERILVVYLYDRSDPVSENNMNYFVKQALDGHDGCDYVFIVRGAGDALVGICHILPVFLSQAQSKWIGSIASYSRHTAQRTIIWCFKGQNYSSLMDSESVNISLHPSWAHDAVLLLQHLLTPQGICNGERQ